MVDRTRIVSRQPPIFPVAISALLPELPDFQELTASESPNPPGSASA